MAGVLQDHKGVFLLLRIECGDAVDVFRASLGMLQSAIRRKELGFLSQGANIFGSDAGPLIVNRNFDWLISYDHPPRTVPIPKSNHLHLYGFV